MPNLPNNTAKVEEINQIPDYLYHATISAHVDSLEQQINITRSRSTLDFGQGFYLTGNYKQAEKFSRMKYNTNYRIMKKQGKDVSDLKKAVMIFEVDKDALISCYNESEIKFFEETGAWLKYCVSFRQEWEKNLTEEEQNYKFIYGPMIDGEDYQGMLEKLSPDSGLEKYQEIMEEFKHLFSSDFTPFPRDHQYVFKDQEVNNIIKLKGVEYNGTHYIEK